MKTVVLVTGIVFSVLCGYTQDFNKIFLSEESTNPYIARYGDIDNDGLVDVVVGAGNSGVDSKLAWYKNAGNGQFYQSNPIFKGDNNFITEVHIDDIDIDGDLDVVAKVSAQLVWFENQGMGNFSPMSIIDSDALFVNFIHSDDIDGDGDIDVLIAGGSGQDDVIWYENNGEGIFGEPTIITSNADWVFCVSTGDIDDDGDLDVLSASSSDNKIAWYENEGEGVFGSEQIITNSLDYARTVMAEDLDGDGDLDVLASGFSYGGVMWYENDGTGLFGDGTMISTETELVLETTLGDIDGDGDADVAWIDHFNANLVWNENDGEGNYGPGNVISFDGGDVSSMSTGDLNADGFVDILMSVTENDRVVWCENDGTGEFEAESIVTSTFYGALSGAMADVTGNGFMDCIFTSSNEQILCYENYGSGFYSPYYIPNSILNPNGVLAIDLDGDLDLDLVSFSSNDGEIVWNENDGTGGFNVQTVIVSSSPGSREIHFADLDNDDDLDLIDSRRNDDIVVWFENDGTGNFGPEATITDQYDGPRSVHAIDIDEDGDLDIALEGAIDTDLVWFENDGLGTFEPEVVISTNVYPLNDLFPVDLDADGDEDFLISRRDPSNSTMDNVGWLENLGAGEFSDFIVIDTFFGFPHCKAADIDTDGDLDVLVETYGELSWFVNDGLTNFVAEQSITAESYSVSFFITGNLDGDEDIDIAVGSSSDDELFYFENNIGNGCTDETACNYNPDAYVNDLSCCYGICGCTDMNAVNYDSEANCDDESCDYRLLGRVFFDENSNGVMDQEDYGLALQQVVSSEGDVYFTNDNGEFYADFSNEMVTFTLSENDLFPVNTTPNPQSMENGINTSTGDFELQFGVKNFVPEFGVCVDFYASGLGYPCDELVNHNICVRNMGNVPINGVVEVEFDPLFQDYIEVTPIDSVVENVVYFSYENLEPGVMEIYDLGLLTPTVDFVEEYLTSIARVHGIYEGVEEAYMEEEMTKEMTCSYDPNDKQVFPPGYADPHYILPSTELEYLVRFQNTGNAPATNVVVMDTLDSSLDLSTFTLMANSHSVITTIDPDTREVEFLFENIMLPDSTSNEPESHGLISFKIRPFVDLPFETEINNTGFIYFDNNPPIVTNTTWNTIYDCNESLAEFVVFDEGECLGEPVVFESTDAYVEDYAWYVNDEFLSFDGTLSYSPETTEEFEVLLMASNPLCVASQLSDYSASHLAGDANIDGVVNVLDLVSVSINFGCTENCFGFGDANGDLIVDVLDLIEVSVNYGSMCD